MFAKSLVELMSTFTETVTWLQTARKSVSTEAIKQCFKKCGFDAGDISIINEEIDTEFQELFEQIYSETTLDEYIDFDGGDNYIRASC